MMTFLRWRNMGLKVSVAIFFALLVTGEVRAQVARFVNPIVTSRDAPDPWVIYKNGYYYFTATTGADIYVWKSQTLTGIDSGVKVTVWTPPASGPQSKNIWAPELHLINGKWYIYYAADDGNNANHRTYVLEAVGPDPQGPYIDRGKIYDPTSDRWAIDGTVLQKPDGSLYFLWSGWPGFVDGLQNLYIAPMSNPLTISGPRVLISTPNQPWEWWINEGPEVLQRGGNIFIVYSANASWTPNYCLAMLMNTDGNVLGPGSWTKSTIPVFFSAPGVFGPGHNTFTTSPDGTEDWFVYHATDNSTDGWANRRPRAQRFTWSVTGVPIFGYPVAPQMPLARPSGETPASNVPPDGQGTGLTGEYYDNSDFTAFQFSRTDAEVNFTWGIIGDTGAPAPAMGSDFFSVRWRGEVQPKYSEDYRFHTYSDDGVRLWVNDQLIIDNWTTHGPTVNSSSAVRLVAGQRYKIQLEYFEYDLSAVARLEWSSLSQPLEVVPHTQLYPLTTNSAPIVSITMPANNSSFPVGSIVTLGATASDSDGQIARVEFFSGTFKIGEDTTAPYTFAAATNGVLPGTYPVHAVAIDNLGAVATSGTINVTITAVPNNPPVVTMTKPVDGSSFPVGSAVTLEASASDLDGQIMKVEFFSDTLKLSEDVTGPFYTYTANTNGVPPGTYPVHARATDNRGAMATSQTIFVTLK